MHIYNNIYPVTKHIAYKMSLHFRKGGLRVVI